MSRCASILVLLTAGCAAHAAGKAVGVSTKVDPQAWRRVQPATGPAQEIAPPAVHSLRLENGLDIFVVENHGLPLVATQIVVRAGQSERAPGLARLVLEAVARGSAAIPDSRFADRVAALGATVATDVQADFGSVTTQALAEHWPETMQLTADAVMHPDLSEQTVVSLRQELTSQSAARSNINSVLAFETAQHALYGDHPYGWTPATNPHAYEQIKTADAQRFHADYWQPGDAAIIVVGDVTVDAVRRTLQATFGSWGHGAKHFLRSALPAIAPPPPASIRIIHRAAAKQATVIAAARVPGWTSPGWPALVVANRILGGGFDSRLNTSLRYKKGYSYALRSTLTTTRLGGLWYASAAVRLDKAGESIKEILQEIDGLRSRPPSVTELETARNATRLFGALDLETNGAIATALTTIVALDLPTSELAERLARLGRVEQHDIAVVAAEQLNAARASIVVIAPPGVVEDQLRKLGMSGAVVSPPE